MPVGAQPTGTHYGQQLHPSLHAVGYGVTPPGLPAFPVEARVPDLPDAIAAWNSLRTIMSLWMAFSIIMVIVAPFLIFLSLPFGVLGIVASSMHPLRELPRPGQPRRERRHHQGARRVVATMNLALAAIFLLIAISAAGRRHRRVRHPHLRVRRIRRAQPTRFSSAYVASTAHQPGDDGLVPCENAARAAPA